jgi:integrase family protein with SAM-like domain
MNLLAPASGPGPQLPILVASGARASYRFLEFFTAQIRNPHTRRAYARAATEFFDWLEAKGVTQLAAIESVHVATYIEQLSRARSAPTAKLRLAALRHLFDWMVIGQIMPTNASADRAQPRPETASAQPRPSADRTRPSTPPSTSTSSGQRTKGQTGSRRRARQ